MIATSALLFSRGRRRDAKVRQISINLAVRADEGGRENLLREKRRRTAAPPSDWLDWIALPVLSFFIAGKIVND
ncbi:hypothetical protein [Rhizobium sp.]|uniref:hypothetical protein n=1 Tax=Rhizobium sp. TaxID=391 RepID=UPI003F7F960D